MLVRCLRRQSTSTRPELLSLLPKKKTLNRILFDNDSQLSYRKVVPVLENIYTNLDTPEGIALPVKVTPRDLMCLKNTLAAIRAATNTINPNLLRLENELVEQAAERGDNDAIAMLAFETIKKRVQKSEVVNKEDYDYANTLVKDLTAIDHPLTYKLGGDLAFSQGYHQQAHQYWTKFILLEQETVAASHVYTNLGIYYFSYHPNLEKAREYFEKAIAVGEVDNTTIKAHYYLGQLYERLNPELTRYHWEVAALRGLTELFPLLGFLEMNMFKNYVKALEWFKLGEEALKDVTCIIGQFDCYVAKREYKLAHSKLQKLRGIWQAIERVKKEKREIPKDFEGLMKTNEAGLKAFFNGRRQEITKIAEMVA